MFYNQLKRFQFFFLILSQVNKFTKKTVEFVDPKNDHEKLLQSYV